MRRFFGFLTAGFLLTSFQSATAFDSVSPLQSLQTADENRGWEAVGRLNFGDVAYCTGALIDVDLVLTAAHCLYNRHTGERFDAQEIEFLAGWRNGRAAAYRGIARVVAHPDFTYSADDRVSRVAHDLALLRLDQPIRNPSMTPYEVDRRPRKGASVGVVSYARERSEAASLQESCHVMARQGGVLVLSCEVDHGASGSPIFVIEDGKAPQIVSVISAMAKIREKDVALGTALTRPLAVLQELMEAPEEPAETIDHVVVSRNLPTVRNLTGFGQTASGGAKFLKPVN